MHVCHHESATVFLRMLWEVRCVCFVLKIKTKITEETFSTYWDNLVSKYKYKSSVPRFKCPALSFWLARALTLCRKKKPISSTKLIQVYSIFIMSHRESFIFKQKYQLIMVRLKKLYTAVMNQLDKPLFNTNRIQNNISNSPPPSLSVCFFSFIKLFFDWMNWHFYRRQKAIGWSAHKWSTK